MTTRFTQLLADFDRLTAEMDEWTRRSHHYVAALLRRGDTEFNADDVAELKRYVDSFEGLAVQRDAVNDQIQAEATQ